MKYREGHPPNATTKVEHAMTQPVTPIDSVIDTSRALSNRERKLVAGRGEVDLPPRVAIVAEVVMGTTDGQRFIQARLSIHVPAGMSAEAASQASRTTWVMASGEAVEETAHDHTRL